MWMWGVGVQWKSRVGERDGMRVYIREEAHLLPQHPALSPFYMPPTLPLSSPRPPSYPIPTLPYPNPYSPLSSIFTSIFHPQCHHSHPILILLTPPGKVHTPYKCLGKVSASHKGPRKGRRPFQSCQKGPFPDLCTSFKHDISWLLI